MGLKPRHSTKQGKVGFNESRRESTNDCKPKFSLEHLAGDYCLSKCEDNEKVALINTLHKLSKLSWQSIFNSPRHGLGFERITFSQLSGISEKFKDKKIIVFRFHGKAPMLGYREDETFYILALDRDLTCYNH